jgi:hypothetical protein
MKNIIQNEFNVFTIFELHCYITCLTPSCVNFPCFQIHQNIINKFKNTAIKSSIFFQREFKAL